MSFTFWRSAMDLSMAAMASWKRSWAFLTLLPKRLRNSLSFFSKLVTSISLLWAMASWRLYSRLFFEACTNRVIKALSQDLRRNIPEVKGLTPGGLYYCKRFYLLYNKVFEMFPQLEETSVPQLGEILKPMHSAFSVAQKYPLNIFAIPWGHHKVLIDNFESEPQKALFYAAKTLQNNWSRAVLENMIGDKGKNNGLYDRQGIYYPYMRHRLCRYRFHTMRNLHVFLSSCSLSFTDS